MNNNNSSVSPNYTELKKGSVVRIKKKTSYWYNNFGTVVNIEKNPNLRYPITVRFEASNYINVNTQSFSRDELILANEIT